MHLGDVGVVEPLLAGQSGGVVVDKGQRSAGRQRQDLQLRGLLEVIQLVERLGDAPADDDHTVVAEEQDAPVGPEESRNAFAFGVVEGHARVVPVVGDPVVESARVLVEHEELEVDEARERRGVRHVGVQNAAGLRDEAVEVGVEVPRGRIRRRVGLATGSFGVEEQQLARSHLGEMPPARVEKLVMPRRVLGPLPIALHFSQHHYL